MVSKILLAKGPPLRLRYYYLYVFKGFTNYRVKVGDVVDYVNLFFHWRFELDS